MICSFADKNRMFALCPCFVIHQKYAWIPSMSSNKHGTMKNIRGTLFSLPLKSQTLKQARMQQSERYKCKRWEQSCNFSGQLQSQSLVISNTTIIACLDMLMEGCPYNLCLIYQTAFLGACIANKCIKQKPCRDYVKHGCTSTAIDIIVYLMCQNNKKFCPYASAPR